MAGQWTAAPALRTARDSYSATPLPDGRVLLLGGYGVASPWQGILDFDSPIIVGPLLARGEWYDPR